MPLRTTKVLALLIVVLVAATLVSGDWILRRSEQMAQQLESSVHVRRLIFEWRVAMVDAETAQRGFLLTADARHLAPFERVEKDLPRILTQLRASTVDDPQLVARIDRIAEPTRAKLTELRSTVMLAKSGLKSQSIDIVSSDQSRQLTEQLRDGFDQLLAEAQRRTERIVAERRANIQRARVSILFFVVLVGFLLLLIVRLLAVDERRRAELRQAQTAQTRELEGRIAERTLELSQLSTQLQNASEAERSTIARELHDEMGGLLTAAKMDINWLHGRLSETEESALLAKLSSAGQALDDAMNVERRVVENLRPSLLVHFGLSVALRTHFEDRCAATELNCVIDLPELITDWDYGAQLTIFRVAQQALENVIRHGKARNLNLSIDLGAHGLAMTIVDDGAGFDVSTPPSATLYGITGMRHRIISLGGEFSVQSIRDKGTRLHVLLPRTLASVPTTAVNHGVTHSS